MSAYTEKAHTSSTHTTPSYRHTYTHTALHRQRPDTNPVFLNTTHQRQTTSAEEEPLLCNSGRNPPREHTRSRVHPARPERSMPRVVRSMPRVVLVVAASAMASGTESCVDQGPWDCREPGCPSSSMSCAALADLQACDVNFSDIWTKPPAGTENTKISAKCPRACNQCRVQVTSAANGATSSAVKEDSADPAYIQGSPEW